MVNFFETLVEVLKADKRFFTEDGILLRNKVYESAINMDTGLIELLLGNGKTKKCFFTEVLQVFSHILYIKYVKNSREDCSTICLLTSPRKINLQAGFIFS